MRKQKGQKGFVGKKPNNYNIYLFDVTIEMLNKIKKTRGERSKSSTIRALIEEEYVRNG